MFYYLIFLPLLPVGSLSCAGWDVVGSRLGSFLSGRYVPDPTDGSPYFPDIFRRSEQVHAHLALSCQDPPSKPASRWT